MRCNVPRIVIAAVHSSSGKTIITTGLIAALTQKNIKVQAYKVGPDYIDPGYHALASGRPSYNLDTWLMGGKEAVKDFFLSTSQKADICIIEGVMGLYDGGKEGISSTAEIAKLLDAPVLLVIDAKSMGESAAALAYGFQQYDQEVALAGIILNRLGSENHKNIIVQALNKLSLPVFGAWRRDEAIFLPERYLGVLPIQENKDISFLSTLAGAATKQMDLKGIYQLAQKTRPMPIVPLKENISGEPKLSICLAIAQDEAFTFYYEDSLQLLKAMGAKIIFFSPLRDSKIPAADGVILGGGFPELFAARLSSNKSMLSSFYDCFTSGMPIYAECGGYMYLKEELACLDGNTYKMASLIPGKSIMKQKLQMIGYIEAQITNDSILGNRGSILRGHEFHFSQEDCFSASENSVLLCQRLRDGKLYKAGYADKNIFASYLHLNFSGMKEAAWQFMLACNKFHNDKSV